MNITLDWLKTEGACSEGVSWFKAQEETDGVKVIEKLIKEEQLNWANWTICRLFSYKQKIQYAVFAAESVIDIYEKKYPDDKRPREAIEAAKKCIDNPTKKNNAAAYAAHAVAHDADAAAYAAHAAYAAAYAADAAHAVYAVAYAADAAAYAVAHAAYAAHAAVNAADAAAYAAVNAANTMKIKILDYGIRLLKEGLC